MVRKCGQAYLQSSFLLRCQFGRDFLHESNCFLRGSVRRLITVATMSILMDDPDAIDPLFFYSRASFTHRSQANAVSDDVERFNAFPAGQCWNELNAALQDPNSEIGIGLRFPVVLL